MSLLIEELSLNAWPALQTVCYDGWLLRFANGYTSRANSINPLYASTLPLLEKIRFCQEIYAAKNLDVIFKLTAANFELDKLLEEQGYAQRNPTLVQTLDLNANKSFSKSLASSDELSLTAKPTEKWLNAVEAINNIKPENSQTLRQMLPLMVPSACFAAITREDRIVATGMAVLERGYVGLFDIATASEHRQQGLAYNVVNNLLEWGRQHGATKAYLQVVEENTAARNLYRKIGFSDSYQYWYRVKPRS